MRDQKDLKFCPEDKLLLYCARKQVKPEIKEKILYLLNSDLDWQYLLQMASRHRLKSILYHNLHSICPNNIPEDVLRELKVYFNVNIRKNLLLTGELIKILEILKSNGFDVIPYKGPVLSYSVFGNLFFREFDDLDVIIKKSDALKIKSILSSEGYEPAFYLKEDMEDVFLKSQNEIILRNEKIGLNIEFQWKFSSNFFSFPIVPESILGEKTENIDLNNHKISVFTRENTLLILCLHAAGHHWSRLAWICDIAELIEYNLNWNEILDNATLLGIKKILYTSLFLANELFNAEIPNIILNEILLDKEVKKISNKIRINIFNANTTSDSLFYWTFFHLKIRENFKDGLIDLIRHATIPSTEELKKMELCNDLYFVYYFFKPLNLVKRFKL